jgi:hypothetical protein
MFHILARLVRLPIDVCFYLLTWAIGLISLPPSPEQIEIGGLVCKIEVIDSSGRRRITSPHGMSMEVGPTVPDHALRSMLGDVFQKWSEQNQPQPQPQPQSNGADIGGEVVASKPEQRERGVAPSSRASGWRAEDSYFFSGTARVVPVVDHTFESALSEAATGLTLTGAKAEVRSVVTYLTETKPDGQPKDGKVVVRFSVCGCRELDVCVKGGTSATVYNLRPLNPRGSDVAVALSVLDGELTQQVWSDGRAADGPFSRSWCELKQPTPKVTETIRGVEVVSCYAPGSMASWRGVYVMCVLQSQGTTICMSDAAAASAAAAPAATPAAAAHAPVHQHRPQGALTGRKDRLLAVVDDLLRSIHAEEPRPSFDEACAEIRSCATDPETGDFIGIDNGESDDVIDEAMENLPEWDEDWQCDEDYAEESDEDQDEA